MKEVAAWAGIGAMVMVNITAGLVAYNRYSNDVVRLENRYDDFVEEFSNILQRQAHVTTRRP